jgi:hypothetical protein
MGKPNTGGVWSYDTTGDAWNAAATLGSGSSGGSVTTASYFVPSMLNWQQSTASLPLAGQGTSAIIINDKIYLFGLGTAGAIYTASLTKPEEFSLAGTVIGGQNVQAAALFVVSSSLYILTSNKLLSSTLADPLTWFSGTMNHTWTFPQWSIHVIGSKAYSFGGIIDASATNHIYSASLTNLLTWSDTGKTTPGSSTGVSEAPQFIFRNRIWSVGGWTGSSVTNQLIFAEVSDPLTWYQPAGTGFTLSYQTFVSGWPIVVEDKVYVVGQTNSSLNGINDVTFSDNGLFWVNQTSDIPGPIERTCAIIISGVCYLYGGGDASRTSTTKIIKTKGYVTASTIGNLPTYPSGTSGLAHTGHPSWLSMQQRLGGFPESKYLSSATLGTSL